MDTEAWDRMYAGKELLWSAEPNRFVVEELAGVAPGRALDLACGEGRNALWLASRGFDVHAVDFSGVALERARRMADARSLTVRWEQADLATFVPEPRAYTTVLVCYLQLPWDGMAAVLDRAADAVAPGGTLLVVGHDLDNLTHGHGGPKDPAVLYTPAQVAAVAEGRGLTVERAESVRRPVETDGGRVDAIDALVRASTASATSSATKFSLTLVMRPAMPPPVTTSSPLASASIKALCSLVRFICGRIIRK